MRQTWADRCTEAQNARNAISWSAFLDDGRATSAATGATDRGYPIAVSGTSICGQREDGCREGWQAVTSSEALYQGTYRCVSFRVMMWQEGGR